jgi:two-component system nitrate/nitrite response regulator NarL
MTTTVRIGIADDHAIFRQGLRKLFDEHPEFSVVGEASNGAETIEMVTALAPDVLLLDLQLGDMTGLDVLRRLGPGLKCHVIVLGADIQRQDEINAILLGASGIVRKYAASETLFKSIRSVIEGEIWVRRDAIKDLIDVLRGPRTSASNTATQFGLTGRELEIVKAVVLGMGNKEISETLGISQFTVKHYLTRIFDKLLVNNRVELVLFATRQGLAGDAASAVPAPNPRNA